MNKCKFIMAYKCSAFGCKSGYTRKNDEHDDPAPVVSYHAFPLNNAELCQKWVRANPRKDFVATKNSKLCSLHFHPSDFVAERTDSNASRRRSASMTISEKPMRRHLKPDAVPSIFPNAPKYLSTPKAPPRTTNSATSTSRHEREARRLHLLEESLDADDNISGLSLSEIQAKLQAETALTEGYLTTVISEKLIIYLLDVQGDVPRLAASITVDRDLKAVVSVDQKVVPRQRYKVLLTGDAISRLSQIVNFMARVKSWATGVSYSDSLSHALDIAANVLKDGLNSVDSDDSDEYRCTCFIIEQLRLLSVKKFGRSYSPQLTITAFLLHSASPAAYSTLLESKVLCLPSVSTLKKVTRRLESNTGLDNMSYLKLRISKLNEHERTVIVIIDEIYVAKRVEYSGGDVQGLTADGSVASTLLCFMVKSLTCTYKDIIAIFPICMLTADKLHECYEDVMVLLHAVQLRVVAVSVDNAATNRKFYVDKLCGGTLKKAHMS